MAVAILCGFALVGMAALVIDPFGLSPVAVTIPGVNTFKIARNTSDRVIKPYDAIRIRPKTVIIGTSRIKQAFNPAPASDAFAPVYNAGIDALKVAEARQLLEGYLRADLPIEHVWMEVFPYQFGFFKRGEWAEVLPSAGKSKIADVAAMTFSA